MSRHRTSQDQMGYDSDRDELIGMIRALQNRCAALETPTTKTTTATASPAPVQNITIAPPTASTSFLPQSPNTVFAGPATGAASDTPAFRGLVALDIPNLDASKITTGTMATARLGSGSATATTYLRGDSTWAALSITNSALPLNQVVVTNGTSPYTVLLTDDIILCDCSGGSITINLPDVTTWLVTGGANYRRPIFVKRIPDAAPLNTLTVDGNGTQTVENLSNVIGLTLTLTTGQVWQGTPNAATGGTPTGWNMLSGI